MDDASWEEYQRRFEERAQHVREMQEISKRLLQKTGERLDKLIATQERNERRFRRAAKAFRKAWDEESDEGPKA
jgi:hypothetical protein